MSGSSQSKPKCGSRKVAREPHSRPIPMSHNKRTQALRGRPATESGRHKRCAPLSKTKHTRLTASPPERDISTSRADRISCPCRSPSFLNCRERCCGVAFQQGELLIRACSYLLGQCAVIVPEIRIRAMHDALKRLCSSGFVIGQCALDTRINTARV